MIDLSLNDAQQELCRTLLRTGLFGNSLADCVERLLSRQLLEFEAMGYFRDKVEITPAGQATAPRPGLIRQIPQSRRPPAGRAKLGGGAVGLRSEVAAFAEALEKRLRVNDHKSGWGDCSRDWLIERLNQEVAELRQALGWPECGPAKILHECCDVAAFAMMIADVAGGLLDGRTHDEVPW